jgi:hypothetical protein
VFLLLSTLFFPHPQPFPLQLAGLQFEALARQSATRRISRSWSPPRDHRRRSGSHSPHLVVQLRIVGCPKAIKSFPHLSRSAIPRASNTTTRSPSPGIETPPLTKKPVPQLDHLRRPRSPLLAGTIDDPRRTLSGPIHTARLTVETPPAAEVETPAAAERVRTGLDHSIWIFSTTFYNPYRRIRLYLFIRLRFSNLFIRHNNLFIRQPSSNCEPS